MKHPMQKCVLAMVASACASVAFGATPVTSSGEFALDPVVVSSEGRDYTLSHGYVLGGQGAITLDSDTLGFFDDITNARFVTTASTYVVAPLDEVTQSFFNSITIPVSVASVTIDTVSKQLLGVGLQGGALAVNPVRKGVSDGGSISITNMSLDLAARQIRGTVSGANGVGQVNDVALFDLTQVQVSVDASDANPVCMGVLSCGLGLGGLQTYGFHLQLSDMALNAQARDLILQGMGVAPHPVFAAIFTNMSFPFASMSLDTSLAVTPGYFAASVPEPGTYALMGLGLAGVLLARRRGIKPQ